MIIMWAFVDGKVGL